MDSLLPSRRDQVSSSGLSRSTSSSTSFSTWRGWLARVFLIRKLDYLLWTCTVIVFFSFLVLFQMLLPGSVTEDSSSSGGHLVPAIQETIPSFLNMLDFGGGLNLEPLNVLKKFHVTENHNDPLHDANVTRRHVRIRKPKLALVFGDLFPDPIQMLMVTVATALQDVYEFEVYSLEEGPIRHIWESTGVLVTVVLFTEQTHVAVDWLNFDGIIVNSLEAKGIFACLMQDPFRSLPLIWTIHESTLAMRSSFYLSSGQIELVNSWRKCFNRSTVVVFPNYALPMIYSTFDSGNYYVIPGSPTEVWEASTMLASYHGDMRTVMGYKPDDVIIAIVGSDIVYSGLLLEHTLILQALLPVFEEFNHLSSSNALLKIIVITAHSENNFGLAIEAIAGNLSYPKASVKYMPADGNASYILNSVDLVIYGSFLEEQSFPDILKLSMFMEKPIIAPNLVVIRKHVYDRVNGYLFPKEGIGMLTKIVLELTSGGKLSTMVSNVTAIAKTVAKNLMVEDVIKGYTFLLETALKHPSVVETPNGAMEKLPNLASGWRWDLFEKYITSEYETRTSRSFKFLNKFEKMWNQSEKVRYGRGAASENLISYELLLNEMNNERMEIIRRREEEMLKDRNDQSHSTWDEIYRYVRRADHSKNVLHERDERELERTGQPLCIYEPFFGEGVWPFLHIKSLYRGVGLSSKSRRPKTDDIDASANLPLLSDAYYRDVLGEFGAFFAIANRIDRIHKNAWIGFQSWRATARKVSLSATAEKALLRAIETKRHGDALYFWARMDTDPRNTKKQEFWSFCDSMNAGHCRDAVSKALKMMYGIKENFELPPMPRDGGTWSVMSCWALPTRSFLEFVMFSRMFVNALDAEMFYEHHNSGHCYLSSSKDKHCYTRALELLINIWAYHSARGIIYVNPESGSMQEQHPLRHRRGHMWVKWFSYSTLKSMDEDLAEVADSDPPKKRWLWPSTGEVIWQGILDREKKLRERERERRKQLSKQRQKRLRRKRGQQVIGKYVKPPPEDYETYNSTMAD